MNQLCQSEALCPEKDMRYKLRFVSVHKGQGGGFEEQETKKKGRKRGINMKPTIMAIFVILLLHNGTTLMTMMLMMWRKMICCQMGGKRHICCTTSAMDQRSTKCATRRIKYYVLLQRILIQQFQKVIIYNVKTIQQHSTENYLLFYQMPLIETT